MTQKSMSNISNTQYYCNVFMRRAMHSCEELYREAESYVCHIITQ